MNRILCCDWLPERARWRSLARSGLPALFMKEKKMVFFIHVTITLLTKFVRPCSVKMAGYWSIIFHVFMDRDEVILNSPLSMTHIFQTKLFRLVWSSHVPVSLVLGQSSSISQHNLVFQLVKTTNFLA